MLHGAVSSRVNIGNISTKAKKYFSVFYVSYQNATVYIIDFLVRSMVVGLRIWIFSQLYKTTYAISGVDRIGGLTIPMVIWSVMFVQAFENSTRPPIARIIDEEVKSGALAYSINRPYSYILFHFFGNLGRAIPRLSSNIICGIMVACILVGPLFFSVQSVIFGLFLLGVGFCIDFCISFIIGLGAFWFEDIWPFLWIYSKGKMVLGGAIIPLSLFPDVFRNITELLPFSQSAYSAARILVSFDSSVFLKYFCIQFFWMAFLIIAIRFLFSQGLRYVSSNGG